MDQLESLQKGMNSVEEGFGRIVTTITWIDAAIIVGTCCVGVLVAFVACLLLAN
jgi:hypothetical protein